MFEKNMGALREKNPALAEKIEKIDLDSIGDITVAEAENEDLIIGYKEIALHSMVDPVREARALWNKTVKSELKKNDMQIVFGLGLGYLFKRAYASANSKIILVEPFIDILRFVLQHVDFSSELADERVYITDNTKDVIDKLREEYLQGDKAEFLFLPAYASLAKEQLENLTERSMKIIEEKSSDVNTIFNLAPMWTRNLILNMPYFLNSRPLGFFRDMFADKTALLISAGPTLAENIEKIKQNKDKFVTIAAGKSLKVLADNDIIPDFVTFADARSVEFQIKGIEEALEKTNVIVTSRTDVKAVQSEAKNKILYLPETDPFSVLFSQYSDIEPGIYRSASSVSIINYFIAKALGFGNIAFVGLDLAFPDNRIYATGEELEIDENGYIKRSESVGGGRKVKYVKDVNGNDIATRDDYVVFIRQFEEILEGEVSLSRVINTSTRGAYVNGMDYTDFDSFIESVSGQNIDIDRIFGEVQEKTAGSWVKCLQKVSEKIYAQKSEIMEIREESGLIINEVQNILQLANENIDNLEADKISELNQKLVATRKKIMKNLIVSTSVQGMLWSYTKNYRTDNLITSEVIMHNLKEEEKLFRNAFNISMSLVECIEAASEKMETQKTALNPAG